MPGFRRRPTGFKENIRLGSLEYVKRYARIPAEANGYVEQMSDVGKTVWYLTVGRTLYAIFGFSDELRKETPEAMRRLKEMNIVTSVMTADNKRAGLYLAIVSGQIVRGGTGGRRLAAHP